MAKTITAMLGIAINEGAIHSIPAQTYVPDLTGTELGRTPIRALLHMSSGIQFSEDYSGSDDDATLTRLLFGPSRAVQAVARLGPHPAPFGTTRSGSAS